MRFRKNIQKISESGIFFRLNMPYPVFHADPEAIPFSIIIYIYRFGGVWLFTESDAALNVNRKFTVEKRNIKFDVIYS